MYQYWSAYFIKVINMNKINNKIKCFFAIPELVPLRDLNIDPSC